MRPGPEAPPDEPDSNGKRGLEAEWNELVGAAAPTDPATPDPGDSVSALADELDVGRSAEPDVPLDAPRADEERTMATMMSGSWAMATRDASPSAGSPSESSSTRNLRESDAEMAAIMGADLDAALERHRVAVPAREAAKPAPAAASPTVVTAMSAATSEPHEARPLEDHRPRIAVASQPRRMVASDARRITGRSAPLDLGEPSGRLSLGWAAVAGVAIAGAIWWFQRPPQHEATPRDDHARLAIQTESNSGESKRMPRADERAAIPAATELGQREPMVTPSAGQQAEAIEPRALPEPTPTPTPRVEAPAAVPDAPVTPAKRPPTPAARPGGDPRTPPPGTPPDVAAVFVRLPVSPADLPPVGGVGATGLHIDRIEMGASYDKTFCGGVADRFSLAATSVVNVCLRAVHPRQEETVSIVWQKNDGSSARRGKIAIKPLHAYRTRAYLVLRKEYVGDWTVRIQSADGVELASHAFTIAP